VEEHLGEMSSFLAAPQRYAQYVAYMPDDRPVGFVEASLRTDSVVGTTSSPVAFLEGIYVVPEFRGKGIGRELLAVVSTWAAGTGCRELASDALLESQESRAFHRALGFEETERVVFFRKALGTQ